MLPSQSSIVHTVNERDMRVLVTGGIGFIGSHLCEALLEKGHTVVAIDNFDPFYPRRQKDANLSLLRKRRRFSFIEADVRRCTAVRRVLRRISIDHVFHLAGRGGLSPSMAKPFIYLDETLRTTLAVLEACRGSGVASFVFASSSSVYGVSRATRLSEEQITDQPTALYAALKKAAELVGHVYHHNYRMTVVNARLFSVYGPRGRPDQIISKIVSAIDSGEVIPWYRPEPIRDFTYVADIVDGLVACLSLPASTYAVLNLGSGHPHPLSTVVQYAERRLGKRAILVDSGPPPRSDFPRTCASVTYAHQLLSWRPTVCLSEGIERFVDWYRGREISSLRTASAACGSSTVCRK
jgi:UDP-glucuronate 4-epimerase